MNYSSITAILLFRYPWYLCSIVLRQSCWVCWVCFEMLCVQVRQIFGWAGNMVFCSKNSSEVRSNPLLTKTKKWVANAFLPTKILKINLRTACNKSYKEDHTFFHCSNTAKSGWPSLHSSVPYLSVHCKGSILKILNKYSQKWNGAATVPIPTFMFLWVIYISIPTVCLFWCRKISGPIVGIYKSLAYTWMWKLALRPCSFFSGST